MMLIFGTVLATLAGLAFGSFLNVCVSRWPAGESVVKPRSHCRNCGRTLAWWENVPVVSWLALRGRCRTCRAKISWRYPVVELAVGTLWAACVWQFMNQGSYHSSLVFTLGTMFFCWLLVGLAVLDAEHLWLPDAVTIPAILFGTVFQLTCSISSPRHPAILSLILDEVLDIGLAAGLVLLIRWIYWLVRRREGIGLGDAKLMAMLAAWLGLPGALMAFAIGVVLGAVTALILLALPAARRESEIWALTKLPLGTFLCIGGIISAFWGHEIIGAYLHWSGLS